MRKTRRRLAKLFAVVMAAATLGSVRASSMVPVIAMPAGVGYAIDAKGNHQSDAACVRDAVRAPKPRYPIGNGPHQLGDEWQSHIGESGLFRLDIDPKTGHVVRVTAIKSTRWPSMDGIIEMTLHRWAFKPGKWQTLVVATTIHSEWKAIAVRAE
jgi:hypothetical protein